MRTEILIGLNTQFTQFRGVTLGTLSFFVGASAFGLIVRHGLAVIVGALDRRLRGLLGCSRHDRFRPQGTT
jgi:hypothetical protein